MFTLKELLAALSQQDIKVWAEGEHVRIRASQGTITPTLQTAIQEHKVELLAWLRQYSTVEAGITATKENGTHTASSSKLCPIPRHGILPLSFAQERLWFLYQWEGSGATYNISAAWRISGSLNRSMIEQAINKIVHRHEALRTTFPVNAGVPQQRISSHLMVTLPCVDLQHLSTTQQESKAHRIAMQAAQYTFDLENEALLRSCLLQLTETEHLLLLTMHHIIADAWSLEIFIRELVMLYDALLYQKSVPLQELPLQYVDFASWQRQWLQGDRLEQQISYWKQHLTGAFLYLPLPFDYPRPSTFTFNGMRQALFISSGLAISLNQLSQQEGATLFMTLLTAFNILLYAYSGQKDITVATPSTNRDRKELEEIFGFFVNTLIIRTDLTGNPNFLQLLSRVREITLNALAHQYVPFERLVQELHLPRDMNYPPLVQVAFVLQDRTPPLELSGLMVRQVEIERGIAKTDLTFSLRREADGEIRGFIEYNTDLFQAPTITRMQEHFLKLLQTIVKSSTQRLSTLLLSAGLKDLISSANVRYTPGLRVLAISERTEQSIPDIKTPLPQKQQLSQLRTLSNLTRNQLLVWVGQKMQTDLPVFNMTSLFTFSGELSFEHFQKAFQVLVNSSDALRMVFEEKEGIPRQRVIEQFPYLMEYLDLSCASSTLQAWAYERGQRPFQLERCLFDSVLLKLAEGQHAWYLGYHHLIADAWSSWIICNNVSDLYERSLCGPLPEKISLPSYRDYIASEREHNQSIPDSGAKDHWTQIFAAEEVPICFYGRVPQKHSSRVQRVSYSLGKERTKQLRELAAQQKGNFMSTEDISLFYIFITLLCLYLYRISGSQRIALGTPFHNRRTETHKQTIGLLMEVLPLVITIEEQDDFHSLFSRVRTEVFETFRYGQYALSHPQYHKTFDVFINYQPSAMSLNSFHGLLQAGQWIHSGFENDSLALQIHDFTQSGNIAIDFDFHCDVFAEELQQQAITHFLQVVDGVISDSHQRVQHIQILTPQERQHILFDFNQTADDFMSEGTIIDLFEKWAQATPEQVAVVYEQQYLSYKEVNQRANQIARYLQSVGVGPGTRVGIYLRRSPHIITALLGVLKAGGAYTPLDPDVPRERLFFMLHDARIGIVLTQQELAEEISDGQIDVICLDASKGINRQEQVNNLGSAISPDHLCYVLYTSGSSGVPKGVMITHRSLYNAFHAWKKAYHLDEHRYHYLQMANFTFDVFIGDLVRALCSGGTLILCPRETLLEPPALYALLQEQHIHCAEFVPAVLRKLQQYLQHTQKTLSFLRLLIIGSDTLYIRELEKLRELVSPDTRIINSYGVTEATIDSTYYEYTDLSNESRDGLAPIGRPFANTRVYILDRQRQPVPVGVPGELYIGGVALAQGYVNQPQLTAENFIRDPFSTEKNARLYQTHDLATYLPDGTIVYLGRTDQQVKIRGYRVESAEIEIVMQQHPAVELAIITVSEVQPGDTRLIGYIVPQGQQLPTSGELRQFLRQRFPEYMIPSLFITIDAVPLNAHGKVDRQQLPTPDFSQRMLEDDVVPPRTTTEEILLKTWKEVLKIEQIGIHDNYFDLGGHSLQAVQLVSNISDTLKVNLSIKLLFLHPTIAQLAVTIDDLCQQQATKRDQGVSVVKEEYSQKRQKQENTSSVSSSFFQLERRPLLPLLITGKLPPIEAVSLGYLPSAFLEATGLERDEVIETWYSNLPTLTGIKETHWGRVATISLPLLSTEFYTHRERLMDMILDALAIARQIGARMTSLTGLIPSATEHGLAIAQAIAGRQDLPGITTGHATTCASVVLTIQKMLQEAGRSLAREHFCFIGLGSIGLNTLRLLLQLELYPNKITLCDIYGRLDVLENIRHEITATSGFRGQISIVLTQRALPPEVYEASFIVGATNVADVLDIKAVKAGTLLVDDSAPHCFSPALAIQRIEEQGDILISEGGVLRLPSPIHEIRYVPHQLEKILGTSQMETFFKRSPFNITGCIFSSLLSSHFPSLLPTVGDIDGDICLRTYEALLQAEVQAADLHCEHYILPKHIIRSFQQRFSI